MASAAGAFALRRGFLSLVSRGSGFWPLVRNYLAAADGQYPLAGTGIRTDTSWGGEARELVPLFLRANKRRGFVLWIRLPFQVCSTSSTLRAYHTTSIGYTRVSFSSVPFETMGSGGESTFIAGSKSGGGSGGGEGGWGGITTSRIVISRREHTPTRHRDFFVLHFAINPSLFLPCPVFFHGVPQAACPAKIVFETPATIPSISTVVFRCLW